MSFKWTTSCLVMSYKWLGIKFYVDDFMSYEFQMNTSCLAMSYKWIGIKFYVDDLSYEFQMDYFMSWVTNGFGKSFMRMTSCTEFQMDYFMSCHELHMDKDELQAYLWILSLWFHDLLWVSSGCCFVINFNWMIFFLPSVVAQRYMFSHEFHPDDLISCYECHLVNVVEILLIKVWASELQKK